MQSHTAAGSPSPLRHPRCPQIWHTTLIPVAIAISISIYFWHCVHLQHCEVCPSKQELSQRRWRTSDLMWAGSGLYRTEMMEDMQ